MSIRILLNESNASRRCVPIMCFQSNGTSACTNESGRTFMFSIGGAFYGSGGSISAVSSVDGAYMACFSASKVSVLGPGMIHYSSNTALPWAASFEVVPVDSYDSMRMGLFALPNAAPAAAGGLPTFGTGTGQLNVSGGSVGLVPGVMSGVSVEVKASGIVVASIGVGAYSGVTFGINNIAAGDYSGVTTAGFSNKTFFQTSVQSSVWSGKRSDWTTPGSFGEYVYSQVTGTSTGTVQGLTRVLNNSDKAGYGLAAGDYSGATVGINNILPGIYSGVSVEVKASGIVAGSLAAGAITSAKFASGAIDAVALSTDAGQEIADAVLGRNIAGGSSTGRTVSEALYPLRNRSLIQGSVGTVYLVDDATSSWTFSPSLGTAPLAGIDPIGP